MLLCFDAARFLVLSVGAVEDRAVVLREERGMLPISTPIVPADLGRAVAADISNIYH